MAEVRRDLLKHLGPSPSVVQRHLVERACILSLHCALFDRRLVEAGGVLDERSARQFLAYSNSLARVLTRLGVKGQTQQRRTPTLEEAAAAGRKEREAGRFAA